MNKTIGIIGGMGPLATCDLMKKMIELDPAVHDQDHVRIVVDSNTNIPDRTAAILQGGPDPVPEMIRSAVALQEMGADVLVMSCNTAHYFYDRIIPHIHVPLLHMIRETAAAAGQNGCRCVGLLATDGTLRSHIYDEPFAAQGITLLHPAEEEQRQVMAAIYNGVKAGDRSFDPSGLRQAADSLVQRGAEALILGCTELPLAFEWYGLQGNTLDPTIVLAKAALRHVSAGN